MSVGKEGRRISYTCRDVDEGYVEKIEESVTNNLKRRLPAFNSRAFYRKLCPPVLMEVNVIMICISDEKFDWFDSDKIKESLWGHHPLPPKHAPVHLFVSKVTNSTARPSQLMKRSGTATFCHIFDSWK